MDGSGSFFCAVRIVDHGDSARHEAIRWLLQKFLRSALSSDLAAVLFTAAFHVRDCPHPASIGSPHRLRSAFVALVGLSNFSSELPGPDSKHGHGRTRRYLVACR